jgi:thymidylate synthase (FAD)
MGDDSSIVQSARVSYGKGTKKVSTDEGFNKIFNETLALNTI